MKPFGTILIVDDEEIALKNLARVMSRVGYDVTATQSSADALKLIEKRPFDVLLTDLRMEGIDGMQLLKDCRARHPDTEVIMITGYATAETAVEAMKAGAFYYIAKPFQLDEARKVVSEAMEKIRLRRENRQLREQVENYQGKVRIITQNDAMRRLLEMALQIAPTDCSVLITGESGTGKELFARFIHHHGSRSDGPYIAVNCGAFSKDLLANELFGHEKEAFTGALTARKGLIETASGGTLFLDEVTEMSPDMQVKLLRVLQEKEVFRLGATQPTKVDIRIIAATNRDIKQALKEGILRQDLYFRLNVVTLNIPPLSQRREDIPLLASHFLQKFSLEMKKDIHGISDQALEKLMHYPFPGNVRELVNIMERGCALARTHFIELADLPDELRESRAAVFQKRDGKIPSLEEQEKDYIQWVISEVGGNHTAAAQVLGINRSSLWRKLKSSQNP
ncbi:MAG: sigma-54 dependent transcriptional regulator [Sulfuricella denitrificans]|nr:sigma-54 dependent transcriptional regulator [Sulfuricella denitrificans]